MNRLLFYVAAAALQLLQALPLGLVAWLGRGLGGVSWIICWHQRRQVLVNLDIALGKELSLDAREQIARAHFRMLGESLLCALKTSAMDREELKGHLQIVGLGKLQPWIERSQVPGLVVALGHFSNIAAYCHAAFDLPWMQVGGIFRRGREVWLERVLDRLRKQCPCRFFDESADRKALRSFLREGNVVLALMSDINPGPGALAIPFFGVPAATSTAPAVRALRHRMPLHPVSCFRLGPGRWRVEIGDQIPTRVNGRRRRIEEILADLNSYLEATIRRDPANWCWAQPRWEHEGRSRPRRHAGPT